MVEVGGFIQKGKNVSPFLKLDEFDGGRILPICQERE
jgi:hypothetical protein